jgi:hypothetical protein
MKKTIAVVSIIAMGPLSIATPFARLVLNSPAGDYIGQGQHWDTTYLPTDPGYFSPQVRRETSNKPSELLFVLGDSTALPYNTFALCFFGTDGLGLPLAPGYYPDVRRADFAPPGFAGLDISWQNRGSNELSGWLQVNKFGYTGTTGNFVITEFDADFGQSSELTEPIMTGHFTYSSVPEPASFAVLGLGILALVRRKQTKHS